MLVVKMPANRRRSGFAFLNALVQMAACAIAEITPRIQGSLLDLPTGPAVDNRISTMRRLTRLHEYNCNQQDRVGITPFPFNL